MKKLTLWGLCTILLFGLMYCGTPEEEDTSISNEEAYFEDYLPPENHWGFLDKTGQLAIPAQFDQIGSFSQGLCAVNQGGKWGYIRPDGSWAILPHYQGAWAFHDDIARVWTFQDEFIFIDSLNNSLFAPSYENISDLAGGRIRVTQGGATGFLDRQGKEIISPTFQSASDFNGYGMAKVKFADKYGLIDTLGNYIIPANFTWMGSASDRYVPVRQGQVYGIFDLLSKNLVANQLDQVAEPMDQWIAVKKRGQWYLLDLISQQEISIEGTLVQGLGKTRWAVLRDQLWYLIDEKGNLLHPQGFQQINRFQEDRACCMQGDLWGYLAPNGQLVVAPSFGLAWDFVNGLARVAGNKGIYFIHPDGSELYQPGWLDVRDFIEGLCPVEIGR